MTAAPSPSAAVSPTLRHPTSADGAAMWGLVKETGVLEVNSCYAYLLLSAHFADTCLVAELDGRLVGFVAAYRPPRVPDVLFVWQVGVVGEGRRRGLAKRMLHTLIDAPACRGVSHLEATVAPSNLASERLFMAFAREQSAPCAQGRGFQEADFGPAHHEAETLFRIGPLRRKE